MVPKSNKQLLDTMWLHGVLGSIGEQFDDGEVRGGATGGGAAGGREQGGGPGVVRARGTRVPPLAPAAHPPATPPPTPTPCRRSAALW